MIRIFPVALGLLWVLAICLVDVVESGTLIAAATSHQPTAPSDPGAPTVIVRTIGPTDPSAPRTACAALERHFGVNCEIGAPRPLEPMAEAWVETRQQLDARVLLSTLFRRRSAGAALELDITSVDIFEPGKPYVFGLASLTDRVGVVSLARLGNDPRRRSARLSKLALHEVGHSFGLPHHDHRSCVMRQDATIEALDSAPLATCSRCRDELDRRQRLLTSSSETRLDRVRRLLAGGHTARARRDLADFLARGGFDPDLLDRFALAFLEARHPNEAISVLRYLVLRWPEHAVGHAHLGLAYRLRASAGDTTTALRHYERALELRPRWPRIAAQAELLRSARAQGPARERPQLAKRLARASTDAPD